MLEPLVSKSTKVPATGCHYRGLIPCGPVTVLNKRQFAGTETDLHTKWYSACIEGTVEKPVQGPRRRRSRRRSMPKGTFPHCWPVRSPAGRHTRRRKTHPTLTRWCGGGQKRAWEEEVRSSELLASGASAPMTRVSFKTSEAKLLDYFRTEEEVVGEFGEAEWARRVLHCLSAIASGLSLCWSSHRLAWMECSTHTHTHTHTYTSPPLHILCNPPETQGRCQRWPHDLYLAYGAVIGRNACMHARLITVRLLAGLYREPLLR